MNLIDKLERKLYRVPVPQNLIRYLIIGMAGVFLLDFILPTSVYSWLTLTRAGVLRGEVWRLVTFLFLPPNTSIIWIVFSLYLLYMFGTALEARWGSRRFLIFYALGALLNIVAAFVAGAATNTYLNMTLLLAFAAIYPDFQLTIFFVLPIKIKWLALLDVLGLVWALIVGPTWAVRLSVLLSVANVLVFLGPDLYHTVRAQMSYYKTRANFKRNTR